MLKRNQHTFGRLCNIKRRPDELPVKDGLAITPSDMFRMQQHGLPISTANSAKGYTGEKNPSWDIEMDRLRGVDVADLWQESKTIHEKVRIAHSKDRKLYD